MNDRVRMFGLILLTLMPAANLYAEDHVPLLNNPFVRPPSEVTLRSNSSFAEDGSIRIIELQATMVIANTGLANVGGRIFRPGDDVDGYTLLQVYEDRAIFSRDGKRLTIFVKPQLEEDDD